MDRRGRQARRARPGQRAPQVRQERRGHRDRPDRRRRDRRDLLDHPDPPAQSALRALQVRRALKGRRDLLAPPDPRGRRDQSVPRDLRVQQDPPGRPVLLDRLARQGQQEPRDPPGRRGRQDQRAARDLQDLPGRQDPLGRLDESLRAIHCDAAGFARVARRAWTAWARRHQSWAARAGWSTGADWAAGSDGCSADWSAGSNWPCWRERSQHDRSHRAPWIRADRPTGPHGAARRNGRDGTPGTVTRWPRRSDRSYGTDRSVSDWRDGTRRPSRPYGIFTDRSIPARASWRNGTRGTTRPSRPCRTCGQRRHPRQPLADFHRAQQVSEQNWIRLRNSRLDHSRTSLLHGRCTRDAHLQLGVRQQPVWGLFRQSCECFEPDRLDDSTSR